MKRIVIVGGETHIGEVTRLQGEKLTVVGAAVREEQVEWAREQFGGLVTTDPLRLFEETQPDLAAIANENDRKAEAVLAALDRKSVV